MPWVETHTVGIPTQPDEHLTYPSLSKIPPVIVRAMTLPPFAGRVYAPRQSPQIEVRIDVDG